MSGFNLERWCALWERLGLSGKPPAVFRRLRRAHGQWWRAYHDGRHVADCLARLDELKAAADRGAAEPVPENLDLIEVAIWFHDAVYVPWLPRNEERSAAWATRELRRAGMVDPRVERVESLILATRHGRAGTEDGRSLSPDIPWMVDIDLSILGADRERFDRFERQIRREYRWVGASRYRAGRKAVMEGFLAAPSIYRTAWFRRRFEDQAESNIRRAIAGLSATGEVRTD